MKRREKERKRNASIFKYFKFITITCRNESLLFVDRTDTWSDSRAIFDFFEVKLGKQHRPRYTQKIEQRKIQWRKRIKNIFVFVRILATIHSCLYFKLP